jgi:hypothetical protein
MGLLVAACATPSPTPSGATSLPTASPGLDLATIPIFVDDSPMAGDGALRVGFADGRTTRKLSLKTADRRWYAFSWMTGGRMAYAVSDPDLTEIHLITAATGDVATFEVKGHPTITVDLTLAPDGRSAFFVGRERIVPDLPGNPDIGAATGVWRVDLNADGVPERILPPATPTDADPFWTDGHLASQLFLMADGSTLVAADWIGGISPARIRVIDLATGSKVDRSAEAMVLPIGVSGRDLVGLAASDGPQRLVALDLDSGLARQIFEGEFLSLAIQRMAPIASYVDNTIRANGKTELHVVDLRTGADAVAFRSEDRIYEPALAGRLEAPPDWIFLAPDAACLPPSDNVGALLNWHTGELVPLGMAEAPPGTCNGQG